MFTSKTISGSRRYLAGALAAVVALGGSGLTFGQYVPTYSQSPYAPPVQAYTNAQPTALSPDQLDQLLAPVALYPDPLLAQVLAAATYPQDIADAAQWLQSYPSPSEDDINAQPWDASIKALVHFPNVINMLASQLDWTQALGSAFANQQQDVMDSVQRLRGEAEKANTLASNDQQVIVGDPGDIQILPAQPDEIYVPEYDPTVVYAPGGYIDFGVGFPIYGTYFDLGWDWRNHGFDRGYHWNRDDWRHPQVDRNPPQWQHDRSRPIPAPRVITQRPHGVEPSRGWDNTSGGNRAPAFDPRNAPRPATNNNHPVLRPVTGIQPHPTVVQPRPAPVVQPRPAQIPHFENRPAVTPTPNNDHVVRPTERAVVGLPSPPAHAPPIVTPHPAPIPVRPVEPVHIAPSPAPVFHPAPAPVVEPRPAPVAPPAFHVEPGANVHVQSDRGNASIGGGGGGGGRSGGSGGRK